jgi:hypothetical protein
LAEAVFYQPAAKRGEGMKGRGIGKGWGGRGKRSGVRRDWDSSP